METSDLNLFQFAYKYGSLEIIRILLSNKYIDVNIRTTDYYYSQFHLVIERGDLEIIKLLINDKLINVQTIANFCKNTFFICQFVLEILRLSNFY